MNIDNLYGPEDLPDLRDLYIKNKPGNLSGKTPLKPYGYLSDDIKSIKYKVNSGFEPSEIHVEEYFDSTVRKYSKNWNKFYGLQDDYAKMKYNFNLKVNFFLKYCCKYCYISKWSLCEVE